MHIVRVQWVVSSVGGRKSSLREMAPVGLVVAAAGQLEGCAVLPVLKQSGLWAFVTETHNKITEDHVEDSHQKMLVVLMIPWITYFIYLGGVLKTNH